MLTGIRFGLRPSTWLPLPPQSRRMPCPGHSSEGLPVFSLGTATSSSTARPGLLAWPTSPKATSNGSMSKAVASPWAPCCFPPAASCLLSTGTVLDPWGQHPLPQLDPKGCPSLKLPCPPWCTMPFVGGTRGAAELHGEASDAQNLLPLKSLP